MSGQRSSHPFAVALVLVLAAAVGAVAIGSIWANRQLLDTDSWASVSGRALEDRAVRHRVAVFLAEELAAEAESKLGAAGQGEIAEELVPRLRRRGPGLAERAMATPRFRAVWLKANRVGHRELLRVLDEAGASGDGPAFVVDLTPALRQLAESLNGEEFAGSLGIDNLGAFIEPGAARIEVLEAEELEQARDAVRAIRHLPVPATIATLALFAIALLLGRAKPRRTLLGVGLSLAAAGVIALLARAIAGHAIVDALLSRDADREAAEAAWRIATSTIVDLAAAGVGLGGLTVLWALLCGPSGAALGCRRALAPLLRTPLARLWTLLVAVLLFLALMVWAPIAALRDPLGIVLFAAVFGTGALVLAQQTIVEDDLAPR